MNVLKIIDVSGIELENDTSVPVPHLLSPRFEKLSILSVLYFRLNLHRVSFSVVDDKANQESLSSKSILTGTLQRYASAVLGDLNDPVLNVVQRDLALRRFVNVGVDKKLAMTVLTEFYDYRVSLVIDSLAVINNARSSLFFIRKPDPELSRMHSYGEAMFVDSPGIPEECLQKSGVSVQIIKKDDRFPFGNGGVPLLTILNPNDSLMEKQDSFSFTVNIHEIGFEFDPSVVSQILHDVNNIRRKITDRIKSTATKHVPVRSLGSEAVSADCVSSQKRHLFFSLSVDEVSCFVAYKDRPFTQIAVLHFERDKEDCSAVDSLELLDLTPLGKLHRHVVWKCTALDLAMKAPMLALTVFLSDEQNVILLSEHASCQCGL